jgi:hypothetical protein
MFLGFGVVDAVATINVSHGSTTGAADFSVVFAMADSFGFAITALGTFGFH